MLVFTIRGVTDRSPNFPLLPPPNFYTPDYFILMVFGWPEIGSAYWFWSIAALLVTTRAVAIFVDDGCFEILGFYSESIWTFYFGLFEGVAAATTFAPFKSLEFIT